MAARAARPDTIKNPESEVRPLRLTPRPAPKTPARDWSNVVFSVVFCEEARRAWEARAAG